MSITLKVTPEKAAMLLIRALERISDEADGREDVDTKHGVEVPNAWMRVRTIINEAVDACVESES